MSDLPDTEGAARTWLRSTPTVTALVGQRVFFAIPDRPTWPLVVVAEAGALEDVSDAPVAQDLIRFDCWGPFHPTIPGGTTENPDRPDKATTRRVRDAVRSALWQLAIRPLDVVVAGATVRLAGAVLQSSLWVPDPDDGRPRYSILAQLTALQLVP